MQHIEILESSLVLQQSIVRPEAGESGKGIITSLNQVSTQEICPRWQDTKPKAGMLEHCGLGLTYGREGPLFDGMILLYQHVDGGLLTESWDLELCHQCFGCVCCVHCVMYVCGVMCV